MLGEPHHFACFFFYILGSKYLFFSHIFHRTTAQKLLGSALFEAKCPTPPWPREPRAADDDDASVAMAAALPARPSAKGPYAELLDAMKLNRFGSHGSMVQYLFMDQYLVNSYNF